MKGPGMSGPLPLGITQQAMRVKGDYFFLGARCDSALPAAVLLALPVRPLRSTLEAARPALALVFLLPALLAITITSFF